MKLPTALTVLLTIGALLMVVGAAQGASVLSDKTDASAAQYGATSPATVSGQTTASSTAPVATSQPSVQAPPGSLSSLPFTGYAAMSLVLAGLVLLVAGVLLRRVTGRRTHSGS